MLRPYFFIILVFSVLCLPVGARAEISIAVVDVQKILTESEAGKSIQKQIQTRKDAFLAELTKEEQTLRQTEKALAEQREGLSKEEFAKKAKEFEEKLIKTRQSAQSRKRDLDEASAKAIAKLREQFLIAVKSVSDEKGYQLVISRQDVVIGDKTLDITDETMSKLNGLIKNIELKTKGK